MLNLAMLQLFLFVNLGCTFRSLRVEVSRESGGRQTTDDRDILVYSQEETPGQTQPPSPVSQNLSRGPLPCTSLLQGGGEFYSYVERHGQISTFTVRTLVGMNADYLYVYQIDCTLTLHNYVTTVHCHKIVPLANCHVNYN